MSELTTMVKSVKKGSLNYLNSAMKILQDAGVVVKEPESTSIATLLEQVVDLDKDKITAIVQILQRQETFNELVRENISDMEVANRYDIITQAFNDIRSDANREVNWAEKGQNGVGVKVKRWLTSIQRGSISEQYNKVKKIYLEVFTQSNQQIKKERAILQAYNDYRLQLKESQILASDVLKIAEKMKLEQSEKLENAKNSVENYTGDDQSEKIKLELEREVALRDYQEKDKKYQIVKDLSENLTVAYSASESVFSRLNQVSEVKQRVTEKAANFFRTNEIVFTALSASITSLTGLKEISKTQEAMQKGITAGLNDIAVTGSKTLEEGLKAGYGKTIDVQAVKNLVNSIVDFQTDSVKLINDLRNESAENAKQIQDVVNEGKKRFSDVIYLANKYDEPKELIENN